MNQFDLKLAIGLEVDAELADVMIRGDEPWLGRNVLSQSPIQAAAVVVAPVISFQTAKRSAITCR